MFWLYYAGASTGAMFYLTLAGRVRADSETEGLLESTTETFQTAHAMLAFMVPVAALSLVVPPFVILPQWWQALALVAAAFGLGKLASHAVISRMRVNLTELYVGAGPHIAVIVLFACALAWRTAAVHAGWLTL